MRIRQVRPEFWKDDVMAELAPEVRLFYIGLWCVADDAGWIEWNTATIGADLFPYSARQEREASINEWAGALEGAQRIVRHGCGCVQIPTLPTHQRIGGNKSTTAYDHHLSHTSTDTSGQVQNSSSPTRANNANANSTHTPTLPPAREGLPHLNATVSDAWATASGRTVIASGAKVAEYLDDACRRLPAYEVAAGIIRARSRFNHIPAVNPLLLEVQRAVDPFLEGGKAASAKDREIAERAASRKRTAATLRRTHALGAHAAEPHPNCPSCNEGDAA